jgi:hypothetical protein
MTGLRIRDNAVMIDIACNDPDNGNFAARAEQVQIGDTLIELECRRWPAPRFAELGGNIRLSGKHWPILDSKDWVGNWCWNGYWIKIPVAVDFLCWLHARKLYDLTCGEERIFNMWRLDKPFDSDDRAFLDRMLGKPSNHFASAVS